MTHGTPSTHKFAVLLTNESVELAAPIELRPGLDLRVASVHDLAGDRTEEWRDAIGDFAWRERERQRLVCVNVAPAHRPDVLDAENEALATTCNWVWFAFQLARLVRPRYGECFVAQGHASDRSGAVTLGLMQGWHNLHTLIRPNYCGDPDYSSVTYAPNWPQAVAACWGLIDGALDHAGELPVLADRAIDAYSVALRMNGVDHRLPYFVRSAESVLAVPRGGTGREFVRRALIFLPNITSEPFMQAANIAAADVERYLAEIYQLRSDCVHGKDPASELATQGRRDLVAKYEYISEALANATTRWAMREHVFLRTMTRAGLETSWTAGSVPPP